MNRDFVILFVVVNVLILALGGFLVDSDLSRRDSSRNHENTKLVGVELSPLAYRPTYEYTEITNQEPEYVVVTKGSLTLDFFQLSIITDIISLLWFLTIRRKSGIEKQSQFISGA